MWAVIHIYDKDKVDPRDGVNNFEDVVFTTQDRLGAFKYVERWHAGQIYEERNNGDVLEAGHLWVKWIPDPVDTIPMEESPFSVNKKAVPVYIPEWGGGGEED